MIDLTKKHCVPCEGNVQKMQPALAAELLKSSVPEWSLNQTVTSISRDFKFKNFYETIAFVNAIAWIANHEKHHPDLNLSYNQCRITYSTHAISGLSENDFICAAKIDKLIQLGDRDA